MFTGLVEEIGSVRRISRTQGVALTIGAKAVLSDIKVGDSIAVNGVCLTVTRFDADSFTVDMMPETLKASSLNATRTGSRVNLERAMRLQDRFGGHFVSGHVDAVGRILRVRREANAIYLDISCPKELLKYIAPKGSITIDGTSLTVFDVGQSFTVSLIPHTAQATILGEKQAGDDVNIECDVLAKYTERLLAKQDDMTIEGLASLGYGKDGW